MVSKTNVINNSILIFIAATIGYGFFKAILLFMNPTFKKVDGQDNNQQNFLLKNFEYIALGLYILTTFGFQLISNISHTKSVCKNKSQRTLTVLIYTIFPYLIIFSSIVLLVNVFSGWLRPFSNTFGYMAISFMGVSNVFMSMVNTRGESSLLSQIYSDKSMLVNELTPDNYDEFMQQISKSLLINDYDTLPQYEELRNMIKIKNIVAEVIWYILAGTLSLTVSKSIITNFKCKYDKETMKQIQQELLEQERKAAAEQTQPDTGTEELQPVATASVPSS